MKRIIVTNIEVFNKFKAGNQEYYFDANAWTFLKQTKVLKQMAEAGYDADAYYEYLKDSNMFESFEELQKAFPDISVK